MIIPAAYVPIELQEATTVEEEETSALFVSRYIDRLTDITNNIQDHSNSISCAKKEKQEHISHETTTRRLRFNSTNAHLELFQIHQQSLRMEV